MVLGTAGVAVAMAVSPLGCWWGSPKINVSRTAGLVLPLPWVTHRCPWHGVMASALVTMMVGKGSVVPRCPPIRVHVEERTPLGDSHAAGGFLAGGSRRCTWRYFILAGCLGCLSFLPRRAVAGLGDAWAGCAVAVPGSGGSPRPPPAPLC